MATNKEHPVIRSSVGIGGFFAAAFVPSVVPEAYQPPVFWASIATIGAAATWPYLRRAKSLFKQHVAWRFALTPPAAQVASTPTTKQSPETAAPSNDDQLPVPTVEPVFTEEVRQQFKYAYPKAVMKASIERSKGTLEAREANNPYRLTMVLAVINDHGQTLVNCSVVLIGFYNDGQWHPVGKALGQKDEPFNVSPSQPKRFAFLSRDISDPITPEPFLINLAGKRIPLEDNSTYQLQFSLRCEYPIPTIVTVRLDTKQKLNAEATIIKMELAKIDPAVLAG